MSIKIARFGFNFHYTLRICRCLNACGFYNLEEIYIVLWQRPTDIDKSIHFFDMVLFNIYLFYFLFNIHSIHIIEIKLWKLEAYLKTL